MSRETQDAALLNALTRYRIVADAFKSAERVAWADAAIAKIGSPAAQDLPAAWTIYEPQMLRDEVATLVKGLEHYKAHKLAAVNEEHP